MMLMRLLDSEGTLCPIVTNRTENNSDSTMIPMVTGSLMNLKFIYANNADIEMSIVTIV